MKHIQHSDNSIESIEMTISRKQLANHAKIIKNNNKGSETKLKASQKVNIIVFVLSQ